MHRSGSPLLLANAWDVGSARVLASLGYEALATTSGGFAASLGRLDGSVTRDEALRHAAAIVAATALPVSADLEDCFAADPAGVAETVSLAIEAGLAGCSVEDYTRDDADPIYPLDVAVARVAAAAEAAHGGAVHLVLTARAENYLHGRPDIADTIVRLQAFRDAGADVVFAPGMMDIDEIRATVAGTGLPVSVLALRGSPTVAQLAEAGVSRISVGSAFAYAAYAGLIDAAAEVRERGTFGYGVRAAAGAKVARKAFSG